MIHRAFVIALLKNDFSEDPNSINKIATNSGYNLKLIYRKEQPLAQKSIVLSVNNKQLSKYVYLTY